MKEKGLKEDDLKLYANVSKIQKNQHKQTQYRIEELNEIINDLSAINKSNTVELDELINIAEKIKDNNINFDSMSIDEAMNVTFEEEREINAELKLFEEINSVKWSNDWDEFLSNNRNYAVEEEVSLHTDPFDELLTETQQKKIKDRISNQYNISDLKLEKYDYLFASLSGILAGFIDIFLIGEPLKAKKARLKALKNYDKKTLDDLKDSKLNTKVHDKVDSIIIKFTDFIYEYDKKNNQLVKNKKKKYKSVAGAIGYLEERFKVPYDARYAKDLNMSSDDLKMNPINHHLKSLAHQPDIIGLFFSILDQFLDTTTIVDNGKIKIIKNPNGEFELKGKDFTSKVLSGFLNWLGHLMSDLGGSSGTRGHDHKIGAGIPMPFYSLTQLISFNIQDKNDIPVTFAKIAESVYKNGYDFRFGITLAIPVVLNELLIRTFWSIKEIYYNKRSLKDILAINKSREIDRLLLVGHGALCTLDGVDAFIRSGGGQNLMFMFSRMNLVGWTRFGMSAFKETVNIYKDFSNFKKLDEDLEKEWKKMIFNN